MGWIVGIVIVLFFVWLMVVSPGFRGFVFVVAVLGGLGIWWVVHSQNENTRIAGELIKPSEVQLTDLTM